MQIPYIQTEDQQLNQIQTRWMSALNPLLANQLTNGTLITAVPLTAGTNVINHLLSRQMVGWFLTDINAGVTIYRNSPFNDKTLSLFSSGAAQVNLWMF